MSQFDQKLGPIPLGDEFTITLPLLQADGTAWTPTVSAASFMVKTARDDADAAALITKTLAADAIEVTASTATVRVTQEDQEDITATVTLYWSLRLTDATLGPVTPAAGTIKFKRMAVRS